MLAALIAIGLWPRPIAVEVSTVSRGPLQITIDEEGMAEPAASTPLVASAINRLDLERAIAQLPDGCRTAFVLHDVEGFQHHEIATLLGISEGTSKSQVHKARMKLRGILNGATSAHGIQRAASAHAGRL